MDPRAGLDPSEVLGFDCVGNGARPARYTHCAVFFSIEDIPCALILKIKSNDLFRQTTTTYTTISILIWLHVAVFSRPSSGQLLIAKGTNGGHCTLWDRVLFTGSA